MCEHLLSVCQEQQDRESGEGNSQGSPYPLAEQHYALGTPDPTCNNL